MLRRPARLLLIVGVGLLVAFLLGRAAAALYTEALWFDEVGYGSAFWTRIRAIVTVRFVTGVVGGVIVLINLWAVARHLGPVHLRRRYGNLEISEQVPRSYVRAGMLVAALLAGWWLSGIAFPGNGALAVLAWANRPTWGIADPQFQRDLSFYVFSLPVYARLLDYILLAIVWSFMLSVIGYVLVGAVRVRDSRLEIDEHPRLHFAVLIAGLVLLFGIRYWLGRYGILLEGRGFNGGVGYTDVNARLPAQRVMAVLSVAAAGALLYGAFKRVWWPPIAAVVVFVVAGLGLGFVYPSFVQQLRVEPNELSREREFIGWNIEYTRRAFGLADMAWRSFAPVAQPQRDWANASAWLDRLPVWDPEPLQAVFNQLQTSEGYYEFPSIDVDRYGPAGAEQPVAIGVREFKWSGLRPASQTWRTQHLNPGQVRGYGAVVTVSSEKVPSTGDPVYWLRDLEPVQRTASAPPELQLTTPAVYFGESMGDWLITSPASDTLTAEAGALGTPGVGVGSFLRRLAFAIRFGERNLLFTGELDSDSRLIFRRRIVERVSHIAPFLVWDREPYPVIHDGRIQWIVDGYSAATTFPIAAPQVAQDGRTVRYLQNTVKATVDGFTGRVALYAIAPDEPILNAYAGVFPELFQPLSGMDAELRRHLRYPLSYVRLQADILEEYHVDSPEVFYAGQDGWQIPQEAAAQGNTAMYQPQYLIMQVPGDERAEFVLTLPFIARERQNMTAILLVRNEPDRYGEKLMLELPRDGRNLGPTQIRALIEQDAQISRELTFWRGAEREVAFGRVRVLPFDSVVLYVQPLFLSAATRSGSSGSIPQLQRVIVSDGNEVRMGENLRAALAALSGDVEPAVPDTISMPAASAAAQTWPARALGLFEEAETRLRAGDFRGFADAWEELARLLRELAGERPPQ